MTREEYIDFANALKNNYTIDFDKLPEFCDMAISALSENKGDLISRQAVDDIIYDYSRSCDVNYAQIMEYIDKLPSVENKGDFDGMTNGEVIQALFPYVETEDTSLVSLIGTNLDEEGYVPLLRKWWNAPYKAEKGGE